MNSLWIHIKSENIGLGSAKHEVAMLCVAQRENKWCDDIFSSQIKYKSKLLK